MKFDKKKSNKASEVLYRSKALFFDWLFICVYLLFLLMITITFYYLVLNGIPEFTNFQSQLIATLTSIVPIIIIFSIMEGSNTFASWGKRKANLKVIYKDMPMKRSIIRNTIKFLPWQFGHMSTINGIYKDFETPFSMIFFALSMTLSIIYILTAFIRKDNRHLADILAGSRVVRNCK
ncbi:MAG: hypothetical protein K0Q49_1899 [Haloplasmataceae bacterium]|jgi:uncharacterized RDD family membrane protein YckC|nr:hypothetical protein [Haloplasmataceae bacterium]